MKKTKKIMIGNVPVGGDSPVSIQSMTNTDTRDAFATLNQIRKLAEHGCQIIRVAVPDMKAVSALPEILDGSPIPVIADIHFDYRLAIASIKAGVHAIRINPGNIGDEKAVRAVAEALLSADIPVRVGANSGSLPKKFKQTKSAFKRGKEEKLADALVASALEQCKILEKFGVSKIKVSLKASDVKTTVLAYRKFSEISDYPLHIGVTEAGTLKSGIIKSAVGIGALLLDGIGNTIRVSLSADPVFEVETGIKILEACGIRKAEPEIVSCPTCGRTEIDLIALVEKVENEIARLKSAGKKLKLAKIAVMGCVVNGPGEASDAEIGIAGGKQKGCIFRKGKIVKTVPENQLFDEFIRELQKYVK